MKEVWKDVPNYEGLYQVSNLGRVKSSFKKGKILKPFEGRGGYLRQMLTDKNKRLKNWLIHRLVLIAFNGEDKERSQVNHINGIKTDNRLENLEWVTQSENMKHAYKIGLEKPCDNGFKKPIGVVKNNILLSVYPSIREMCRDLDLDRRSVLRVICGKYAHHHGYTFRYI